MSRFMRRFISAAAVAVAILAYTLSLTGSLPQVASNTWQPAGSLLQARTGASTTLMPDGRLLIVGGTAPDGTVLSSAEFFNPDGTFSEAPSMQEARTGHAAIWLLNGEVLVTGGRVGGGGFTNSAESFDPLSNTWRTLPAPLFDARAGHSMTQLLMGDVLIAGGENSGGAVAALETYVLVTEQFSFAAAGTARTGHAAAALADGRVFVAGGRDASGAALASSEIFDPELLTLTAGPDLSTPRAAATATALLEGKVLIAGGSDGASLLASAEIFDPATGVITLAGNMATARSGHQAFLLPRNHSVLLVGGTGPTGDLASAELYLPWAGEFRTTGAMATARAAATGSPLEAEGRLLMAGGVNPAAELFGFATVTTDKPDYAPGEIVHITGAGWEPGETVTLSMREVPAGTGDGMQFAAVADVFGNISSAEYAPQPSDYQATFFVTAVGVSSQAQTTFTDGNVSILVSGGPASIAVTGTRYNQTGCAGSPIPLTPGTATPSSPASFNLGSGGNRTVLVTVPSTSGGYVFNQWSDGVASNPRCFPNITLTYTAQYVPASTGPIVTASPVSQTVNAGQAATFTASASGTPSPTVQWQESTNGGGSFNNIAGATSTTLSFTASAGQSGHQYRAVFTNTAGQAITSAATLTVNSAPSITTDPVNQAVDAAQAASFTAAATGSPTPTVQWQVSGNGGASWQDIAGATFTTLSFTADGSQNGNQYRAVFSNVAGQATTSAATLTVNKLDPLVTWSNPADIIYGTPLGAAQLNAGASVPGTFAYDPAAGTVLNTGAHTLSVTFTPTDSNNYNTAATSVPITVVQAAPVVTWATPANIGYGTPLGAAQLNATASVPGTFAYTPPAGTVLDPGTTTLSLTFTPTDTANYSNASATVPLTVNKAPVTGFQMWVLPYPSVYGQAVDAHLRVSGGFATPTGSMSVQVDGVPVGSAALDANGEGVVTLPTISAGSHQLRFEYGGDSIYQAGNGTYGHNVAQATSTVTWPTPAGIQYGTALSATQLNGTASVPGNFVYTPAAGTVLNAGTHTLSVTFTPSDANYGTATASVELNVAAVTPTLTWLAPAPISYGTALSGAQLNAGASVPGSFAYVPPAGSVLPVGTHTLAVSFTPTDANYTTATAAVSLNVQQATATITWPAPADISYGTAIGATQLNASADVAGTLVYSPPAGTVLAAGPQTLSVNFTPTDTTNYASSSATVQLQVDRTMLSAAPANASRVYGDPDPSFTVSYSGFVNGDTPTVVSTQPNCASSATVSSTVAGGPYAITCSGAAAANYDFTYGAGQLTITPASLVVIPNSVSRAYGQPNPELTGTVTGIKNGDDISAAYSTSITETTPVGTYPNTITATLQDPSGKLSNYNLALNTATFTVTASTDSADLIATATAVSTANPAVGVAFTVTDSTSNQGATAAASSTNRYFLSLNSSKEPGDILLMGARSIGVLMVGSAPSVGNATVTIPLGTAPGTYHLLACADADNAVAEGPEDNNCGSQVQVTVAGPDLQASVASISGTPAAGAAFSVTDNTTNLAAGTANTSVTRFYLSANQAWDIGDVILTGSRTVGTVASGATSTGTVSVTVPAGTAPGTYYLLACADSADGVPENSENNNCAPGTVVVELAGADLMASVVSYSGSPAVGGTFSITDETANVGSGSAATSSTRFYLSSDPSKSANDLLLSGTRLVGAVASGNPNTGSTAVTVPLGSVPGNYYLLACADDFETVGEADETNNCGPASVQVQVLGPDLGALVTSTSGTPTIGGTLSVTDNTSNSGSGAAAGSYTRYYLSLNQTKDAGDILLSGNRQLGAVAGGAVNTGNASVTVPAGTAPGNYYLLACADGYDQVPEESESNNCADASVTVNLQAATAGPDLVAAVTSTTGTPAVGYAFSITDNTANIGSGTAASSSTRYFLSQNAVKDSSDVLLSGTRLIATLSSGASSSGTVNVTIPAGTAPGNYYVLACADDFRRVAEGDEANNCGASSAALAVAGPDLQASVTAFSGTPVAGGSFSVTDSTVNLGSGKANSTYTRYYLSADPVKSLNDTLLSGNRAIAALAGGAAPNSGTATVTVPVSAVPGIYYLLACADDYKQAPESNEGNNCAAGTVQVTVAN